MNISISSDLIICNCTYHLNIRIELILHIMQRQKRIVCVVELSLYSCYHFVFSILVSIHPHKHLFHWTFSCRAIATITCTKISRLLVTNIQLHNRQTALWLVCFRIPIVVRFFIYSFRVYERQPPPQVVSRDPTSASNCWDWIFIKKKAGSVNGRGTVLRHS